MGSQACRDCHQAIYDRWQTTLMANVVQDPKQRPRRSSRTSRRRIRSSRSGRRTSPSPTAPNGSSATGRSRAMTTSSCRRSGTFATRCGVLITCSPAPTGGCRLPGGAGRTSDGPLCDGCHSVNYDIKTHAVTEWNVGCERCHGAGGPHVARPVKSNIVNPSRLDDVRANDVCIQCHSQGQPRANPIEGKYYDWPVGYQPGDRLSATWALEEHRLGENTFTHGRTDPLTRTGCRGTISSRARCTEGCPLLCVPRLARNCAGRAAQAAW